ncbi:DUF3574 domain-containing protein [Erwinia billingiae]|uniref:DUF3574 domain-containing protein n=1 Tax=Erwinia billingiae TaxID=182337 RepID=UPI0030CB3EAE
MKTSSVIAVAVAFTLSGCMASSQQTTVALASCQVGDAMQQTTLYFGLSRPHGADITHAEWQSFVDSEITPRFKDGLTVFDAKGQWLGEDGKVAREGSKALMLIHAPGKQDQQNIEALRTRYKQRFQQESVMRVDSPVCVGF